MQKKRDSNKDKVSRRDFATTSVAAVALPGLLVSEIAASEGMKSEAAEQEAPAERVATKKYPSGWQEGTTIPAEYYLDPVHYHRDEVYLADNLWFMVDHESRIPKAGDYFTFEYGRGENIIILRDKNNKVNAFHNVCRHRGSRLCRDSDDPRPEGKNLSVLQLGASGNTQIFRCPYHGWTYDLEGNLTKAYKMRDDFDLSKNGLLPCHLRVEGGHIFVNLSNEEQPPDFEEDTRGFRRMAKKYGFADLKVGAREQHPIKANWKLVLENFLECYHCGPSHTLLVTAHNWDERLSGEEENYQIKEVEEWIGRETYAASGQLNPGFLTGSLDGKPIAPLLPNIKTWSHRTEDVTTGWSTGYWQAYDDHIVVVRFTPRDAELTDAEVLWLVHPDAVAGKDFDVENLKELWKVTLIEDIWIVENNHLGVMSRGYGPGRYSESEIEYTTDFINWYMAEVAEG